MNGAAEAHRSVVARVEGRRILADAGFPLPFLVPLQLPSKEIPSSFGTLSVASAGGEGDGGGFRVTCDARGEVAELLRLGAGAGARLDGARPRRPLRDPRPRRPRPPLGGGLMTVLDAWSVLDYPARRPSARRSRRSSR